MNHKIKAALREPKTPEPVLPDTMTEAEFLRFLNKQLRARGAKSGFANQIGVSRAFITDVCRGNRKLSARITNPFGYRFRLVPVIEKLK